MDELLGRGDEKFFEPSANSKSDIELYGKKMRCPMRDDDLYLLGNFDTTTARNVMIVFERCDVNNKVGITCKSDSEINQWMHNKFIIVLLNSKSFV